MCIKYKRDCWWSISAVYCGVTAGKNIVQLMNSKPCVVWVTSSPCSCACAASSLDCLQYGNTNSNDVIPRSVLPPRFSSLAVQFTVLQATVQYKAEQGPGKEAIWVQIFILSLDVRNCRISKMRPFLRNVVACHLHLKLLVLCTSPVCSPLAAYNSLTDVHLVEYFSSPRRLRHLRRMGLVSESNTSWSCHCY